MKAAKTWRGIIAGNASVHVILHRLAAFAEDEVRIFGQYGLHHEYPRSPDPFNAEASRIERRKPMDLFRLDGRLALVTGSGACIGLAISRVSAGAAAAVVFDGRDEVKLTQAAAALRADGHTVYEMAFDVTVSSEVNGGVERIEAEIGGIDILVNNAGIQRRAPLEKFSDEAWHELMRTNVDSVFLVSKAVARHMIARRRGRIINICSVQSELGRPNIAPYTASKGAVKMLTKGMAIDWGKYGINVNGLGPGSFKTELTQALVQDEQFSTWLTERTPSGRWGEIDELAGGAIFPASEASSFADSPILHTTGGITASL